MTEEERTAKLRKQTAGIPDELIESGWVGRFIRGSLLRNCGNDIEPWGLTAISLLSFLREMADEAKKAGMSWEEYT